VTIPLLFFFSAFFYVQSAGAVTQNSISARTSRPLFAAQIDLDYVYDPDPIQQEKNLQSLVQRVQKLGVTTVLLQAFADPDADGVADALYFPNRFLPLQENLFATTVRKLQSCGVAVYAWMPLLAFTPLEHKKELAVVSTAPIQKTGAKEAYYRLSPFNPAAVKIIRGIYEDLAESGPLDGILFHDDAFLSDFEDASPAALAAYHKAGFPESIAYIRQDHQLFSKWSRFKTKALITLSHSLLDIVRKKHPDIRSARNLYALTVLNPKSEQWFGQTLPLFLQAYDYTFIMAMPYMEEAENTREWLVELAEKSLAQTIQPAAIVFELQTTNWRLREKIPTAELIEQFNILQNRGAVSFAYYPDDFYNNHPNADITRTWFARIQSDWRVQGND
jgi:biofilm PGA synthesis lipoprotein PgaB